MSNIYIFDFNDSFTFNIANRLHSLKLTHKVIPRKDHRIYYEKILKMEKKVCLILGPGPGHPNDYSDISRMLERLFLKKNLFILGICLGHQILMKQLGFKVLRIKPNHGVPVKLIWQKKSIIVQQYNSLAVKYDHSNVIEGKIMNHKDLIWGLVSERVVSWQFHPESVGTSCPLKFFSSLSNFLYNSNDASKTPNKDR